MKPTTAVPDAQLVWAEMGGLYAQFAPMVRLAHLLTGSVAVAEDVVQDAFIRIAPRYAELENPRGYLRTVVVNGCRSHQRGVARRQVVLHRERSEPTYDAHAVEFFDALKSLKEKERAAIVLRYYCDMADDEIAALLACAPATVRVLVQRALSRLRKVVQT